MLNLQRVLWLSLLVLLLSGCRRQAEHHLTRGFYYWRTQVALSPYERQRLEEVKTSRVYVRMFDIVWNAATLRAEPVALARVTPGGLNGFQVVPVVYITNAVFQNLRNPDSIRVLARQATALLVRQCAQGGFSPPEVQWDCDWTSKTRDAYFDFLTAARADSFAKGKTTSATIRLHQIKYVQRSGIPPVDKGLLMCYNMGNTRKAGAHNSILDAQLARQYLNHVDRYGLPLDLALPLFRWVLLFQDGAYRGILRDVDPSQLEHSAAFVKQNDYHYRVVADTMLGGIALQKGTILRAETSRLEDVLDVASFAASHIKNQSLNVVLYHADSNTLRYFAHEDLEEIFDRCR